MFGVFKKKVEEYEPVIAVKPIAVETTSAVAVEKLRRYLFVKRKNSPFQGFWCFPGGHAEGSETPIQAAQREAKEEVGDVRVSGEPFITFEHEWPADNHTHEAHKHKLHVFKGEITGKLRAGNDAAELGWYTLQEAERLQLTKPMEEILKSMKEL
jgi:8-oxo-dGTP diphosphatase